MTDERGTPDDDADGVEPFEPTGKWANPAIYASNWRRILLVDTLLATLLTGLGVFLMARWIVAVGAFVAAVGLTYLVAVGRRYLQWRWLRQQAGLDT